MKNELPDIYEIFETVVTKRDALIEKFQLGLVWTSCRVRTNNNSNVGLAMSPQENTRLLCWPGTIAGRKVSEIAQKIRSWNSFDVTLALAACNAIINTHQNELLKTAVRVPTGNQPNTSVFSYFRSKIERKKIIIIGRYPHLDTVMNGLDYQVLERNPGEKDKPDTAAEFLVPEADWVFITSTTLINKTFIRLTELAKNAVTVLMGPTTPWLPELARYHVDFLAGTRFTNMEYAEKVAMEGGGTRLFEGGVEYAVANISAARLASLKRATIETTVERNTLKQEIDNKDKACCSAQYRELTEIDTRLSELDTAYKRLWDANKG